MLASDKIYRILEPGRDNGSGARGSRVVPCEGLLAFPGLVDQHVHIIGAGGEEGYATAFRSSAWRISSGRA